jgi:hypothetical protein
MDHIGGHVRRVPRFFHVKDYNRSFKKRVDEL